jgi:protein gp37
VDWTRIEWPGRESTVDVLRGGSWDLDPAFGFVQHSDMATLDWLIVGGESGPGARPMHPDWARSARDQCEAAGVAYYFKQVGAWSFDGSNVGAKLAGRELDGRVHDGFPEER